MIINPTGFTDVITWTDFMAPLINRRAGVVRRLDNADDWQQWAAQIFRGSTAFGQTAPDPYAYDDWRDWATRLFATIDFEG